MNQRERDAQSSDVTIVMATYNGANYVLEQLASIEAQTYVPRELIICDDGSSDDTVTLIRKFALTSAMEIKLVLNETRLGYSENFMKAAGLATTRYISFSDQDDIWYPHKLEKSVGALRKSGALMSAHQVFAVDSKGHRLHLVTQEIFQDAILVKFKQDPWGFFLGFSQTIDRRLLELIPAKGRGVDSQGFEKILAHDRWFYFLASHFGTIAVIAEPLADYRQHSANTFGDTKIGLVERYRAKTREGQVKLKKIADLARFRHGMLISASTLGLEGVEFDGAIERWRKLETFCRTRQRIYEGSYFPQRLYFLMINLSAGAYRSFEGGGLGRKRLLEDMTIGLMGRLLMRDLKSGSVVS